MNEIQIIQKQLATERAHFEEVAQACANHLGAGARNGDDRATASPGAGARSGDDRADAGHGAGALSAVSHVVGDSSADARGAASRGASGSSSEDDFATACADYFAFAVTRFDAPTAQQLAKQLARGPRREFLRAFAAASRKHFERLDALLTRNLPVTEWRAVSRIDADSIFAERTSYSRVKATLPP